MVAFNIGWRTTKPRRSYIMVSEEQWQDGLKFLMHVEIADYSTLGRADIRRLRSVLVGTSRNGMSKEDAQQFLRVGMCWRRKEE